MPCFTGHIYKQKDGKCQGAGQDSQSAQRDLLQAEAVTMHKERPQISPLSTLHVKLDFVVLQLLLFIVIM